MSDKTYPLYWPESWPRTKYPAGSRFDTTLARALDNVEDSLRKFASDSGQKVTDITISSNYSLSNQRPKDGGVAVYFTWDNVSTCIAVDRYGKIEENLQAIHHCIEAERTKLRHGGLNLVRAAFRGYAALPPPSGLKDPWYEVLGVAESASVDVVEKAYQRLRSTAHPDKGGSSEAFHRINAAWHEAQARRVLQ